MDAGPAPLNRIEFHGTTTDLKKIQDNMPVIKVTLLESRVSSYVSYIYRSHHFVLLVPVLTQLGLKVDFYDSGTGFQTGFVHQQNPPRDLSTACSSHPVFTVTDWAADEPLMNEHITKTSGERGCIHLGWTRSGDTL